MTAFSVRARAASWIVWGIALFGAAVVASGCGDERSAPGSGGQGLGSSSTASLAVPGTVGTVVGRAGPASPGSVLRPGPAGSVPGTTAPAGAAPVPCTLQAVKDGLTAGNLELSEPPQFACEGLWAYAYAKVPRENSAPPQVVVLQADGSHWAVVDKATACTGPAVPGAIRQVACVGF